MRHAVVEVTSRLTRSRGETRVDKVLRGCWRNTTSHLSIISVRDFWSCTLKVNIPHASMMFSREVFGEVIGKIFSSLLPVEAELFFLDATSHPVEAHVK